MESRKRSILVPVVLILLSVFVASESVYANSLKEITSAEETEETTEEGEDRLDDEARNDVEENPGEEDQPKASLYHGLGHLTRGGENRANLLRKGNTLTRKQIIDLRRGENNPKTGRPWSRSAINLEINSWILLGILRPTNNRNTEFVVNKSINNMDQLDAIHGLTQHVITRKEAGKETATGFKTYDLTRFAKDDATDRQKEQLAAIQRIVDYVLGAPISRKDRAHRQNVVDVSKALVRASDEGLDAVFQAARETNLTASLNISDSQALIQGAANLGLARLGTLQEMETRQAFNFNTLSQRKINPVFCTAERANQADFLDFVQGLQEDEVVVVVTGLYDDEPGIPIPVRLAREQGLLSIENVRGSARGNFVDFFGDEDVVNLRERMRTPQDVTDNKEVVQTAASWI